MLITKYLFILFISFSLYSNALEALPKSQKQKIEDEIQKLISQNKLEQANTQIDSSLNSEDTQDRLTRAKLYKLKSLYFKEKNFMDSSIFYLNKAWDIASQVDYDTYFPSYLRPLAYYNWEAGNYSESLSYTHEILRKMEKVDSSIHNTVYNILGLTYLELGDYELSKKYFNKAIHLTKKYDKKRYLGVVYANMGELYSRKGNYNIALEYFQKGSQLEIEYNNYQAAGRSYAAIGNLYVQLEQFDKASNTLQEGRSFVKRANDEIGLCRIYLAFGKLHIKTQNYNKAGDYFHKAVDLAKNKSTQKELMEGYLGLYDTYTSKNNYKKASQYLYKHLNIYKELYSVQKIIQIENLQHELSLQQEKNKSHKEQIKKQKTINNLLVIVIILAAIAAITMLLFLLRSRKTKLALKKKNEEINRQKTNLEELNEELKKAKERAENSESLKDQFLRNISHEIRTPLNGIIGFSSVIAQPDISDSERVKYQNVVERNAKILLSTVEDIIDIAKIRTQQITTYSEKFDINALLEELQKLFYFEKTYLNKEKIEILLDENVKNKQLIYTDESKIRKILMVLGNNSIKFTEKGHIKLGYTTENNSIRFFIEDTGIGISEENQQLIFESFRQIDSGMNRNHDGVGLGLTIAKAFVEKLGGTIWFKSKLNEGTTFYFEVPINKEN